MRYTDQTLGYSFDLPDGWRCNEHSLFPSFTCADGHIYVQVGDTADPRFADARERERFLMEPGCTSFRDRPLGGEANTVIVDHQSRGDGVISAFRDGLLYSISYDSLSDPVVCQAIACVLESFVYPSRSQAANAIQTTHSDPAALALSTVLHATSPEEARDRLSRLGMPAAISQPGYTMHAVGTDTERELSRQGDSKIQKKWWQFWR